MKRWMQVATVLCAASAAAAEPVLVDGVAAYVNDSVITVGDVMQSMAAEHQRLGRIYQGDALKVKLRDVYRETLRALVDARLICHAFSVEAPSGANERLDRAVDRQIDEFVKERFDGDRTAFLEALKGERMTLEDWRKEIRQRLIVSSMKGREVDGKVVVSPARVRELYEADTPKYARPELLRLRLIMMAGSATNSAAMAARRAEAQKIREALAGGADFATLARKVSQDEKAALGGDWGWMAASELRAELAEAAKGLAAGGISPVVEAGGDCYILKVEERQAAGRVSFEEARPEIEKRLRKQESERLYDAWIERLKREAYVEIVAPDAF